MQGPAWCNHDSASDPAKILDAVFSKLICSIFCFYSSCKLKYIYKCRFTANIMLESGEIWWVKKCQVWLFLTSKCNKDDTWQSCLYLSYIDCVIIKKLIIVRKQPLTKKFKDNLKMTNNLSHNLCIGGAHYSPDPYFKEVWCQTAIYS